MAARLQIAVVALALSSCKALDLGILMEEIGVTDEYLPPVMVDLVCDASQGSTCSPETLSHSLNVALTSVVYRPGSHVRLWAVGSEVGRTMLIEEEAVPAPKRSTTSARRIQADKFITAAHPLFMKAAEPVFADPHRDRSRSPLLESLGKIIVYAPTPRGVSRTFIMLSDAREVSSFGDWECGPLPKPDDLVQMLHGQHVLNPGSLANSRLFFVHVDLAAIPRNRCRFTLERARGIEDLWKAVLTAANAELVSFRGGPVTTDDFRDQGNGGGS